MVAERIVAPEASKLGMTRAFTDTTLGEDPSALGHAPSVLRARPMPG
jgi:hypothetical protein